MEICFVPDNDYGGFLQKSGLVAPHVGDIVDRSGKVLGQHPGIEFYTVGQRRGLRISSPRQLYVLELDAARNRVVVGDDADLQHSSFRVLNCNWIPFEEPPASFECWAKIRYNHPGSAATVVPGPSGTAEVRLHEPGRAITPGQACVFYQDDLVVGGGWIAHTT